MLAIGRSVFRARLHSSLPVTTSCTAADRAPTPAGPDDASAAGAAASTPATRAAPAIRPVTRAVSQPLVPMTLPLRSQQTTGASLSVTARGGNRLGLILRSGADPVQVDSLQLIFQTVASEGTHDRDDAASGGSAQGRRGPRPGRVRGFWGSRVPRHSL